MTRRQLLAAALLAPVVKLTPAAAALKMLKGLVAWLPADGQPSLFGVDRSFDIDGVPVIPGMYMLIKSVDREYLNGIYTVT